MIKAYSQRLLPPYSGQVQIAESAQGRAVTMDGEAWEFHFLFAATGNQAPDGRTYKGSFVRAASIRHAQVIEIARRPPEQNADIDGRIVELAGYIAQARLPFPSADRYEYWLLDPHDDSPLALIFSCNEAGQMADYPSHPTWTALPAAIMPIEPTEQEQACSAAPVNYRLERLVSERAGSRPHARWFKRRPQETDSFPPCLLREDWEAQADRDLCQRYIERQSTRLLMLHGLPHEDRKRLEIAAREHPIEVERFYPFYPEVADRQLMDTIRIEARLRGSAGETQSTPEGERLR